MKCKSLEAILLHLYIEKRQFALISAYKPPSVENNTFTRDLSTVLDEAFLLCENVICIGDLNADILHPLYSKKQGKCLLDIGDIYDLDSLINKPTRGSEKRTSCLDVILTNVPAFTRDSGVIETGLSNHCLVYTVLTAKLLRPKSITTMRRSIKNFNNDAFVDDLNRVPFSAAYLFDDPDDVYWCWEKLYKQVLDEHPPLKTYHRRPFTGSNFITTETRNAMRERDRPKQNFYKTRNPKDWEKYRQMRNRVTSMRRKVVQEHFRKLGDNNSSDQGKIWKTIKPYINSLKSKNYARIALKDNGKIITDHHEVAETLNEFFTSVAHAETVQFSPDLSHINDHAANTSSLSLAKTNPKEVKDILLKGKPNKVTGHDLIPPRAVKQSADALCYLLSTLINYVLDAGKIPKQWKLGEIAPVHKGNCGLNKSNYRPITILPSISKVFERLVHIRVSPHFENKFHKYVFDYRKHHDYEAALLSLTELWKKELDSHKIVGLVSMDLSKAFETLPHELIVRKLKNYGADYITAELFKDYPQTATNVSRLETAAPRGSASRLESRKAPFSVRFYSTFS